MRRFSHIDNLEPSRTFGEPIIYWLRSLIEFAALIFAASLILGSVFEVGSWALQFFREGSWLALAGIMAVSVLGIAWVFMRPITQRLWLFALLPLLVAFFGPFVSHYLL